MRVAQAGSLLFEAGQHELSARLEAAQRLQAGGRVYASLAECVQRQVDAACQAVRIPSGAGFDGDSVGAALAAVVAPPAHVAAWLSTLCAAMQPVATALNAQGEC